MDPIKFGHDLARKADLAHALSTQMFSWPDLSGQSLVFMGMGSSAFAAQSMVTRLQACGCDATFTLSSNPTPPQASTDKALIAISASGNSVETNDAFDKAYGFKQKIWVTNAAERGTNTVSMQAGEESGGVASLTYMATHIALLRLYESLGCIKELNSSIDAAAVAIDDIYSRKDSWLPDLINHIKSPAGSYYIAPADRFCSAQQSALMMRESPRLPSVPCETGDWSHIDVYLTKTLDYRAILFPGSQWEDQLFKWTQERESKVITIGFDHPHATKSFRYKNDSDPLVRLLAETTFAEILAQHLWVTA
ncbi:sigma factor regulator FecR [Actinomycetes bacterium]|nr:sigma factor regulator FecR [Actinomycetes bacterium]